jgi:5-methylcytosine-specific restriction endonuclease McrA
MKKHTQIYLKAMGYDTTDFIPCEVCQAQANSVHHIVPRGMGGSKSRDVIENLMALCGKCHHEADFGTNLSKEYLVEVHKTKMKK